MKAGQAPATNEMLSDTEHPAGYRLCLCCIYARAIFSPRIFSSIREKALCCA